MNQAAAPPFRSRLSGPVPWLVVLGIALLWNIWPILGEWQNRWTYDPTYQHGWLVPLFSAVILWLRRDKAPALLAQPRWWGLGLIVLGAAMQLVGAYYFVRWLSGASLLAYLAGVAVLVGGWPALRWSAPAIGFLAFMIPLPFRVEAILHQPLRLVSTIASTYLLQTLGLPALREGNVILLHEAELGVVDACSGLKMLIVFFALATAVAFLCRRPWTDKLLIVLSAAPIAIVTNVARITITGVMYEAAGQKWADLVFHDLAGWLMMPLALGLLWCELALLSLLLIEESSELPAPMSGVGLVPVTARSGSTSPPANGRPRTGRVGAARS
jgi:exosortase